MRGQPQPFWQTEPCAPFCVVEHLSVDGTQDRYCEGPSKVVPLALENARYVENQARREAYGVPVNFEVAARHVIREREPIIVVWHTTEDHLTITHRLTLDEAEEFANGILDAVKAARS